ncbi:MAG: YggS family pyridoxal phosphate-dependent enzyme [Gemmatimonadales bacterium]
MPEAALPELLDRIRHEIADARAGNWTHPVRIVAVTKTHGAEAVRAARSAGLDAVGENRVQEALSKQDACADVAVAWHLIGGLQRNKVRHVVGRFALIHSVDRLDLAAELARRAEVGATQDVLVQVNCSAESQKGGVEPAGLHALLEGMRALRGIAIRGLMTMAAFGASEAEQRRTFAQLRTLRDTAQAEGYELPELSMGMSDDYIAAVQEGATMLRLGTALFGGRP